VGMGVLPLEFVGADTPKSLGLDGTETFDIAFAGDLEPGQTMKVTATKDSGDTIEFDVKSRIDTPVEVEYYKNGGILHTVLRKIVKA